MASYRIEFLPSAQKEFAKLPRSVQQRIALKLELLRENPYLPGVKQLKNGEGRLRLRVGDCRVIYRVEQDTLIVIVIQVGHRREVYQ